jgi:hypothetical protein
VRGVAQDRRGAPDHEAQDRVSPYETEAAAITEAHRHDELEAARRDDASVRDASVDVATYLRELLRAGHRVSARITRRMR